MPKKPKNQTLQLSPTDSISLSAQPNSDGTVSIQWIINVSEPLFIDFFYRTINGGEEFILSSALTDYNTGFYPPVQGAFTDVGAPDLSSYPSGTTISYRMAATVGDVNGNASFFSPTVTVVIP